jgi:hypothetical protein
MSRLLTKLRSFREGEKGDAAAVVVQDQQDDDSVLGEEEVAIMNGVAAAVA